MRKLEEEKELDSDYRKKEEKLRNFKCALRCCVAIEGIQGPLFKKTRLLTEEVAQLDRSNEGYDLCLSFKWLHENGSFEGQMEAQTILTEKYNEVQETTKKIIEGYKANQELSPSVRPLT